MSRETVLRSKIGASTFAMTLIMATLVMLAEPSLGQSAEPQIAFLNPSGFASTGTQSGIIVSDLRPDAGPGCCDSARHGYRLSAWVANAPPEARVFFAVVQRALDFEITNTTQRDSNAWEADWDIPDTLLDGPATLFAYLVVNEEPIAVDEQAVTILRTENTTQITHPAAGGSLGIYAPLADEVMEGQATARKAPHAVFDALYHISDDMQAMLGFYTTSLPGTEPKWKQCADEVVGGSSFTANRTDDGLRCTLDPADAGSVTAVATVANDSVVSDKSQNQSGDAVSVASSYMQQPASILFQSTGTQRVNPIGDTGRMLCSTAESVKVVDQFGRAVAGANVDVHATGPSDLLKFHQLVPVPGLGAVNQAPNRGSHATEVAFDCTGQTDQSFPSNANPGQQGEHQRFGSPDRKHVESLALGTNDAGIWSFRMYSPEAGITDYTVWIDETDDGCLANDDTFTQGELSINGTIGWGQDPSSAVPQPHEVLTPCIAAEEPTEEPELDGSRSISMRLGSNAVAGRSGTFTGAIDAVETVCAAGQRVVLKIRKAGGRFYTAEATTTDGDGSYLITRHLRAREYRVVAPETETCDRARSVVVRIRR